METTKTAIILFVVLCALLGGIIVGYLVWGSTRADLLSELATLENRLVIAQDEAQELSRVNRELEKRQRSARTIIARTAGDLISAGREIDDAIQLVDRIIATVSDLERAYETLDIEP